MINDIDDKCQLEKIRVVDIKFTDQVEGAIRHGDSQDINIRLEWACNNFPVWYSDWVRIRSLFVFEKQTKKN